MERNFGVGRNVQLSAMECFHRTGSMMRRLMLAVLVLLSMRVGLAESVSSLPKPNDYVNDFARVLSPDTVAKLDRICAELDHSQANAQVAVVTVRNLDGEDAADWANELEDKWKMGKKGSDRGVLVLLAVDDRKYRIDVGYGLEGILNDAKVGDIGRSMIPNLRAQDYDGAILSVVGQLAQVIATDAKVTLSDELPNPPPVRHRSFWRRFADPHHSFPGLLCDFDYFSGCGCDWGRSWFLAPLGAPYWDWPGRVLHRRRWFWRRGADLVVVAAVVVEALVDLVGEILGAGEPAEAGEARNGSEFLAFPPMPRVAGDSLHGWGTQFVFRCKLPGFKMRDLGSRVCGRF